MWMKHRQNNILRERVLLVPNWCWMEVLFINFVSMNQEMETNQSQFTKDVVNQDFILTFLIDGKICHVIYSFGDGQSLCKMHWNLSRALCHHPWCMVGLANFALSIHDPLRELLIVSAFPMNFPMHLQSPNCQLLGRGHDNSSKEAHLKVGAMNGQVWGNVSERG